MISKIVFIVLIAVWLLFGASMIDEAIQSFKNESYFKFGFFGILGVCCVSLLIKAII